jgi:phenylpropionate dioxygenase-like ring-hydroxylating dioxygenase large terminal subunit
MRESGSGTAGPARLTAGDLRALEDVEWHLPAELSDERDRRLTAPYHSRVMK